MVGEGNHTLRFGEAERVGVRAVFVGVVVPLTVVAVFTCGAVPDSMSGMELFAETTSVWKGEGSSGATGWHVVVVVLWHDAPLEVMVVRVFYCCGQSHSASTHGFWSIMIWDKSAMVEVRMDA